MAMLEILKRFNFFLNNMSDSDMTISDGSWFQVLIVRYKKICCDLRTIDLFRSNV